MGKAKKKPKKTSSRALPAAISGYDWGESRLTEKQRLFVFYFTWPGQDGFHCASRAARNAGYTEKTADVYSCKILRNPAIQKLIQKFESEAKASVHNAAQRFIQEKITRADYDIADFYNITDYVNEKTGEASKRFDIKDLQDLTREQRLCIDSIDAKGQKSTPVYVMADRQKERDSIIALDRIWNGAGGGAGQDLEEIREVIIERVIMRQEKRMKTADAVNLEIIDGQEDSSGEEL